MHSTIEMILLTLSLLQILEVDRDFRATFAALPAHLHPDLAYLDPHGTPTTVVHVYERLFMGFTFYNRLMRLHRGWLARGYTDTRYRYSTETCIASARAYMALVRQARAVSFPGLKW